MRGVRARRGSRARHRRALRPRRVERRGESPQRSSTPRCPRRRGSEPSGTRPGSTRLRRSQLVSTPPKLVAWRTRRRPAMAASAVGGVRQLEREQAAEAAGHLAPRRPRARGGTAARGSARARRAGGAPGARRARARCRRLPRHAQVQRAQPAGQEPGRVGREHAAEHPAHVAHALQELAIAADAGRPPSRSWCPPSSFEALVPADVGAELERPLVQRRGDGVVADQQRALRVRELRPRRGCRRHRQERVGRRLDHRDARAAAGRREATAGSRGSYTRVSTPKRPEHLAQHELELVVAERRARPSRRPAAARPAPGR